MWSTSAMIAQRERTRCLMFLLQDDAPWPLTWVDALHDRTSAEKLAAFKRELIGESTHAFPERVALGG
jgi:hypothetical protein